MRDDSRMSEPSTSPAAPRAAGPSSASPEPGVGAGQPPAATERRGVSHYARGSAANMVRSLALIVVFMAVIFFAVARTNTLSGPAVDIPALASPVARETGWPIEVPVGLPDGWRPSAVRFVPSTDNLRTWHVGYTSPEGHYVAVEQTADATKKWITQQTNRAPVKDSQVVAGRTWQVYVRDIKTQNSLVAPGPGRLTTIVTGDGTLEELTVFAEHLQPYRP